MPTTINPSDQTITQYNIQTGAANNLLNNVAPSATSGVPVISQGASAQPIFGTALVAGGGTGQVTLTNHGVLVGAGTAAITQLATGSAGQVLQSGGASADPVYSTATYPASSGGTGKILYDNGTNFIESTPTFPASASATARTIIVSDGTNWVASTETWAVPGTSGNVLTSNGTNWTSAAPTTVFNPNSVVTIFDDFISPSEASTIVNSQLAWYIGSSVTPPGWGTGTRATSAHPGVLGNSAVGSANFLYLSSVDNGNLGTTFVLGGGAVTFNWVLKVNTLSTTSPRYILRFGLGDSSNSSADWTNGCYFEYSDNINSGKWNVKTANASTRTTGNTNSTVDTSYHNFQIAINAGATSVSYFIDAVQVANSPISTNIPTANLAIQLELVGSVGTIAAGSIHVDLFYMNQTLTTPR